MADAAQAQNDEDVDLTPLIGQVQALARLCRGCLDDESLYDLRIPPSAAPAYLWLPGEAERAFAGGAKRVELAKDDPLTEDFLQRFPKSRLCYGYPVLSYADGALRPLFTRRARTEGQVAVIEHGTPLRLNCGLLRDMGLDPEVVRHLAHETADSKAGFAEKLKLVTGYLEVDAARFEASRLEPVPEDAGAGQMQWRNRPVLAAATMAPSRSRLVRDLSALIEDERIGRIGETALLGFDDQPPALDGDGRPKPLDVPMVFDMHRLGPSQTQAVRAAMGHRLAVVAAPPGTGQMATIVNLVATAVMEGESVLYVSAGADGAQAMTRHLNNWIGRDISAVPLVGRKETNEETRRALIATLRELSKPEPTPEEGEAAGGEQQKSTREKPTLKGLRELDRLPSSTDRVVEPMRKMHDQILELSEAERGLAVEMGSAWTGPEARMAALPPRASMAEWRERLDILSGKKSAGLGGMVKNMLSRDDGRRELLADMRRGLARLPEAVKEEAFAHLAEDAEPAEVRKALAVVDRWGEWKRLVDRRADLIRDLVRMRDGRSIELQAMNQAARKVSGVRELYRDLWHERLTEDAATLERQIDTFFDLVEKREAVDDAKHRAHRSQRLAQALRILAGSLPVWATTLDEAAEALPLEPGCFDLIVVDEADAADLGSLLPLLFRGRRAALFGAALHDARPSPLTERHLKALAADEPEAPAWADPGRLSGLGNLSAWLHAGDGAPWRLDEHFRSHPAIADYLSGTFYDGTLVIRTNFRKLKGTFKPSYLGIHWHNVEGRITMNGHGPINEAELKAAVSLLRHWEDDGLFRMAPRPSVGIATSFLAQAEQLREALKRGEFEPIVGERVTVAAPEAFIGRQVDLIVLLPGIAPGAPEGINEMLASSTALFHDVVGAAKVGVHVLGDHEACEAEGGHAAALASHASIALPEPDEDGYSDEFELLRP
ncbi:MAG TPA: AAA domain-containing protein, partial [Alphaproteobacteria bacterium]|nr:AAA domain-containing protein [Alphaproteobacteria bacterium]